MSNISNIPISHYKVLSLPLNPEPNSVYYVLDQTTNKVKGYIISKNGLAIPLFGSTGGGGNGSVESVTGTGVTGTDTNPIIDISTFVSTQLGNLVHLSISDGKLVVNEITSPDGSLEITETSTELQIQLSAAIYSEIDGKEDLVNKQDSLDFDGTGTKYLTADIVNEALVRNTKLFTRTGIANKNDQFELTVFDLNTVTIKPCDSVVFWEELFIPNATVNDAIKSFPQKNYPLSELVTATGGNINTNPIVADGVYVRYLGYDKDGNVISSPESFIESNSAAQLGFTTVLKTGGTVSFLGGIALGARNVFSQPILANLNDLDRITVTSTTDITINYNVGTPSLKANAGTITGIAINWRLPNNINNTEPIDKYNYLGDSVVDFVSIDPKSLQQATPFVTHTLWTELQDGVAINDSFFNTTSQLRDTLSVGAFAFKRVMIGVRGGIFIQESEFSTSAAYSTIDAAKANVFTHQFTEAIVPPGIVMEIARIIYKKGVTDFSDETQFFIVMTAGGGAGGGVPSSVGDATNVTKGILKLTNDLGGTADLPTVPALVTKKDWVLTINPISGIAYTIGINDNKTFGVFSNINPITFTVPTNAAVACPIGATYQYAVQGVGTVTVGGAGVTLSGRNFIFSQGDTFTLVKTDTDTWSVDGIYSPARYRAITVTFDNGTMPIIAGDIAKVSVPENMTIQSWTVLSDTTGSISVDIWKSTFAAYPPTISNSIVGSNPPSITSSNKNSSSTLIGWNTSLLAGDVLVFTVSSNLTMSNISVQLKCLLT